MSAQALCFRKTWITSRPLLLYPKTHVSSRLQRVSHLSSVPELSEEAEISKGYPVMGTLYIPDPAKTDPSSVLDRLPILPEDRQQRLPHTLFLATTGVASWFNKDNPFLKDAMDRLYPSAALRNCSSIVAIVDNLPGPAYFTNLNRKWNMRLDRPFSKYEGIAICMLDSIDHEPANQNPGQPALLCFESYPSRATAALTQPKSISLTVPTANTLFINGSPHTAYRLKYKYSPDDKRRVATGSLVPLSKIYIPSNRHLKQMFDQNLPLYPLTVPRKVISSMGNVIREVEGDNGKPITASAELEAIIPKFLAERKSEGDELPIQIFARVMAPEVIDTPPSFWSNASTSGESKISYPLRYAIPTSLLVHLGRMYRVMSGGGGWGKKAGLLSLDPATNFTPQSASETSMFPDPDADDKDAIDPEKIGALVPSGHTIEFFAAKVHPIQETNRELPADQTVTTNRNKIFGSGKWNNLVDLKMIFGAAGEGDQERPSSALYQTQSGLVPVLPGCFGALAEKGVSLELNEYENVSTNSPKGSRKTQRKTLHETRIDTPFTLFRTLLTENEYVRDQLRFRRLSSEQPSSSNVSPSSSSDRQSSRSLPYKTKRLKFGASPKTKKPQAPQPKWY